MPFILYARLTLSQAVCDPSSVQQVIVIISGVENPDPNQHFTFRNNEVVAQVFENDYYYIDNEPKKTVNIADLKVPVIKNYCFNKKSILFQTHGKDKICSAIFEFNYISKYDLKISYKVKKIKVNDSIFVNNPVSIESLPGDTIIKIKAIFKPNWEYSFPYNVKEHAGTKTYIHHNIDSIKYHILHNPLYEPMDYVTFQFIKQYPIREIPLEYTITNCLNCK
ncbi:MAG TPA: hypothetical protein VJY62_00700 [Bacteroidia bacterium]|nr:hypothetical protein [Bacteroidia bacterium]